MKHPEVILLPVLMLSDYVLTVLGAIQKNKKYSEHFKVEHYELNPVWQRSIAQVKWFNPRHILLSFLCPGILAALAQLDSTPDWLMSACFGCLFCHFATIIGRHLSNLLIFWRFSRKPEEISGQVTMSHSLVLSMSSYQYCLVALPVLMMAIFSPSPFVLGGLGGIIGLIAVHWFWGLKQKRTVEKVSA